MFGAAARVDRDGVTSLIRSKPVDDGETKLIELSPLVGEEKGEGEMSNQAPEDDSTFEGGGNEEGGGDAVRPEKALPLQLMIAKQQTAQVTGMRQRPPRTRAWKRKMVTIPRMIPQNPAFQPLKSRHAPRTQ